jgi:type II secretory pathway pseudopilin PulG
MSTFRATRNQRGITLIAVVMVVLAIGLIAYFAGAIAVKLQAIAQERNTVNRMSMIRTALEQYYRAHQNLPDPNPSPLPPTYAPVYSVTVGDLQLEQKFRVDAWGRLYHYNRISMSTPLPGSCPQPGNILDLLGLTVEGNKVAAIIVSAGPNQTFDSFDPAFDPASPPTTYPASGFSKNDDVYVTVNLSQQSQDIAREELNTLAKKAYAWDCTCNPSPVPLTLADLITQFSLGDEFFRDPWGQCYAPDTSGIIPRFLSAGPDGNTGTADDITVPSMTKCCTQMPAGGSTTPLQYWNFNNSGDPGTFSPSGGVTTETQGGNTAMKFDGSGYAYAGYPMPASSDPANPTNPTTYPYLFNFQRTDPFSIVVWIKTTANGTILSKMTYASPPRGYRVYISGGLVNFEICSVDSDNHSYTISTLGTTTVTDGKCHHIAVTYDYIHDSDGFSKKDGLTVYVDGTDVTNSRTGGPLQGSISNAVPFQLSGYNGSHDLFTGIIDDVAIYDEVLGPVEINNIWDGTSSTNPLDPLNDDSPEWDFCNLCLAASYWKFDGDLTDSADTRPGTCSGTCSYVSGQVNQALQFTGSNYVTANTTTLTNINTTGGAIFLWVYLPARSSGGPMTLFDGGTGSGNGRLDLTVTRDGSTGYELLKFSLGNLNNQAPSPSLRLLQGTWHNIVLAWTPSTKQYVVYADLTSTATGTYTTFDPIGSTLYFGSKTGGSAQKFTGAIDEAAIFAATLPPGQISTFYANGVAHNPICP